MNRPTEIEPRLKAHKACVMLRGYKLHNCVLFFCWFFGVIFLEGGVGGGVGWEGE